MSSHSYLFLVLLCVLFLCISGEGVHAFGAGNIPSFAFLEGKAFRHGDIEDTLADLAKKAGGLSLGVLIGKGGSKFGSLDIKRVYFGNWLRDYSQAVDVAGLQKLQLQTIINLCMVLGFMAHGYATNEFQVTAERLGVYLPTEHIDNPKGYPDNARQYHPGLRPPVNPQELEIDPQTGMKNYIANEQGTWDTSKSLVRRVLEDCIRRGRQARMTGDKVDTYESYRLLGQALHTLEDFPAHSNFCELALVMMGHRDVFVHVGDQVKVRARNGNWVAPLVTGTFGSSDFIHSLLGEATDHISQASVTDLNAELEKARAKSGNAARDGSSPSSTLRSLLAKLPGSDGEELSREMDDVERVRASASGKRPEDMTPEEVNAGLWKVLVFRDSVVKKINKTIEKIPGLGPLIEKLMDSISVFVFTALEPLLKPLMKQATNGLQLASGEVIDTHDQYEVFNDPRASDPTHSFLSKDHFNLILNEPAGNLGKIILTHTVNLVVKAWEESSMDVRGVTEDILQCLFHPDFHDGRSAVQRQMLDYMRGWVQEMGHRKNEVLRRLTKQAVRNHENIRLASTGSAPAAGSQGHNMGIQAQQQLHGYVNQIPGVSQAQSIFGSAQSFVGKLNTPNTGTGREGGGPYGGEQYSSSYGPSQPLPSTGAAASFYGTSTSNSNASPGYADMPSYAPPPGPPQPQPHQHSRHDGGYAPNYTAGYAPSYEMPPRAQVEFPNAAAPNVDGYPSAYPQSTSTYPQSTSTYPQSTSSYQQSTYPGQSGFPEPAASTYPGASSPSGPLGFPSPDAFPQAHPHGHHGHHGHNPPGGW